MESDGIEVPDKFVTIESVEPDDCPDVKRIAARRAARRLLNEHGSNTE